MSDLFKFNKLDPNTLKDKDGIFYTKSGLPYNRITCFGMGFDPEREVFLIRKEELDAQCLIENDGTIFWENDALAFQTKDRSKIFLSPKLLPNEMKKIKDNGIFTVGVVVGDSVIQEIEIEDLTLCQR